MDKPLPPAPDLASWWRREFAEIDPKVYVGKVRLTGLHTAVSEADVQAFATAMEKAILREIAELDHEKSRLLIPNTIRGISA